MAVLDEKMNIKINGLIAFLHCMLKLPGMHDPHFWPDFEHSKYKTKHCLFVCLFVCCLFVVCLLLVCCLFVCLFFTKKAKEVNMLSLLVLYCCLNPTYLYMH